MLFKVHITHEKPGGQVGCTVLEVLTQVNVYIKERHQRGFYDLSIPTNIYMKAAHQNPAAICMPMAATVG